MPEGCPPRNPEDRQKFYENVNEVGCGDTGTSVYCIDFELSFERSDFFGSLVVIPEFGLVLQ